MQQKSPHATCGAKTRSGKPCQAYPMANGRCRMHGGMSLAGVASPTFKTGAHSKYLPARMVEAYQAALNDPELLDLNRSVALIDARLIDLLGRVDTGESGAVWKDAYKSFRDLQKAIAGGKDKAADFQTAMFDLQRAFERGHDDYAAWGEVARLLDDRRKHVETQQRLETAGERAVPATEVVTLIGAILSLAQEAITNVEDRKRFVAGTQSLIGTRTGQIQ